MKFTMTRRGLLASVGAGTVSLAFSGFRASSVAAQEQVFLNMGTVPSSSGFFTYFVSAGQAIEKGTNGRIMVNVMETGSSVDNLRRIRRGEMEIGLSTVDVAGQAALGIGVFKDEEPWEDLRRLYLLSVVPNVYTVRVDSNIDDFGELTGKRFNPGITGSSTEAQTLDVFDVLGVKPDLYRATTGDAIAAIQDGEIIGYAKSAASVTSADSSFVQLSTSTKVKILGLTPEQVKKVTDLHPYYSALTIPAGVYPNQEKPVLTMGTAPGVVTTKDGIADQVAYDIVKAIFQEKKVQDDAFPPVRNLDFAQITMEHAVVPLHAGAVRYFKEIGAEIPDRLIPPEAK